MKFWQKGFMVGILMALIGIILVSVCMCSSKSGSGMYKQTDPFQGSFKDSETLALDKPIKIVFSVNPIKAFANTRVRFFLPREMELVEGDLEWQGDLKENETFSLEILVRITETSQGNIKVYVEAFIGEGKISRSYYFRAVPPTENQISNDKIIQRSLKQ